VYQRRARSNALTQTGLAGKDLAWVDGKQRNPRFARSGFTRTIDREVGENLMETKAEIKVGCCGFVVSQKKYFQRFNLIEIQKTFYQLPHLTTAEKWRASAPEGFEFTLKAWQLITHDPTSPTYRRLGKRVEPERFARYGRFRATTEVFEAWRQTAIFARTLGASLVVFQCPASFRPTDQNVASMKAFFSHIDREGFRFAWEPRGAWPGDLIRRLCEAHQLVHCVDPFKNKPQFGEFQYFRLHGITGFAYRYTDTDLERLKEWAQEKPTYVFFNNNWMKDDASRFLELVGNSNK
jgi:uncharacterized protein YecE (DUF72 family)